MAVSVPPLPKRIAADTVLFERYGDGDLLAREQILRRHMPMARRLASRHRHSSEPRLDLEQVAYVGLLKAVDRFDPEAGSFIAYAIRTIRGELKRHFRDHGWGMRLSRPLQERWLLVNRATETLTASTGRTPTPRQIAGHLDITLEDVVEVLGAGDAYVQLSLDAELAPDDDGSRVLLDTVGDQEPGFETAEWRMMLRPLFEELPAREQRILRLRFVDDLSQLEIATELGISQMHVSRLIRRSLDTLLAVFEE